MLSERDTINFSDNDVGIYKGTDFKLLPFLSRPIYWSILPDFFKINNDVWRTQELEHVKRKEGVPTYASKSKSILELPGFEYFKYQTYFHLERYVRDILRVSKSIEFYVTHSWLVRNDPGSFIEEHHHHNAILTGVIYLETPSNGNMEDPSGSIAFSKSGDHTTVFPPAVNVETRFDQYNIFNSNSWEITPQPGHILIFPAITRHFVHQNTTSEPRFSLPFNVYVKGTLGTGTYDNITINAK